ncbi:30S ribosomal protein S3ae [Candidatus Micrarchaeota archaeon]|nr:30S ribosomal protein S3ae [Candidatus Micrarchaeota archaeon]
MAVKKRKTADAWKKKEWLTLVAPAELEEKQIGLTPTDKIEKVIGRIAEITLREITSNINHQFVKLRLRVREVKGKTAYTELVGFELMREYLRRNVRRRRSMIRTIQSLKTSDGKRIQVTTFVFTARKLDSSKKAAIRSEMARIMAQDVPKETFIHAVEKGIFGGLATEVFKAVKNIAPTRRVEVYKLELVETEPKKEQKLAVQAQQ